MPTAAAYIRVSTDDQLEYSPDSQLKVIREYADKNGIGLLENCIFIEDGGKSGKSMVKREKFLELIALSKRKPKPFDVILVWKFSRFARNQEEAITLKSMLRRNGIEVISISEPLPDGPFGDLIQRIVEWTDEYYLVNLSQEVKRGMKERAGRGEAVSPPPMGYSLENGKYVPDSNAELIKGIFFDFLSGSGYRALALKYADLGLKTTRGNPPDSRCIEYILRNPVYAGKIRWSLKGKAASKRKYNSPDIMISPGIHTPIVGQDIFDEVQKRIELKKELAVKRKPLESNAEWMLKGLMRCSECGSTLIRVNTGSPSLQCHSYGRGACRVSHGITLKKVNSAVLDYLKNLSINDSFEIDCNPEPKSDAFALDYNKLIEKERGRLNRLKIAYQNGVDTLEEYSAGKKKILESVAELERAQESVATQKKVFGKEKRTFCFSEAIASPIASQALKNKALQAVIKKIVFVKAENRLVIYFY